MMHYANVELHCGETLCSGCHFLANRWCALFDPQQHKLLAVDADGVALRSPQCLEAEKRVEIKILWADDPPVQP